MADSSTTRPDTELAAPAARSSGSSYRRLAANEAAVWRSLYRWIARRPRSQEPLAEPFGYAAQITPLLLAFIVLAALEIPIVSLLLPWPAVRYTLLGLGIWGLLWMLGLLASLRVHPHVVADTGIQLRSGAQLDLHVAWPQIAHVRQRRSSSDQKLHVEHTATGALLSLQKTTNLEVTLGEPIPVRFIDGHREDVDTIRFYADAPCTLLAAVAAKTARAHSSKLTTAATR